MNEQLLLQAQALSVQLSDRSICRNLNLEIAPGEIWGILGQNGSGKTTLLHTLGGLRQPDRGTVHLAGQNLKHYSAKKRAQLLGILFQESQAVFPQSVWEYCLAGRYPHFTSFLDSEKDRLATLSALEVMQLEQKKQQNILTLSGGEWRRLALATLLAQDPRVYLLDEPLNHLDLRHQKQVLHYFQQRARNDKISVLMALHDINIAERYCDRIVMLDGTGGAWVGDKRALLMEERLSGLYGCAVREVVTPQGKWWAIE